MAIFSKLLLETDVTSSLLIPTASLGLSITIEESRFIDMHVHDGCGKQWIFCCSFIHQHVDGFDHFLSVDWLEFVRTRDVRAGDKVIFIEEMKNDEQVEATIKIEVKRKIRLFGKDIWADVK